MKPPFADTSFNVALVSPRDALHAKAVGLASQYRGSLVTTEMC
jgi:predicted nucleic acid-binding protein